MLFRFEKTSVFQALEIIHWEYPPPYHVYNLGGSPLAFAKIVDDCYFSVFWRDSFVGFFCYGSPAQLRVKIKPPCYQEQGYLDVGLGLHPDFCDRGLGLSFVQAGLRYAAEHFWEGGFRLTVAANNYRALKVYRRVGFLEAGRLEWKSHLAPEFIVLTLGNPGPVLADPFPD